MLSDENLCTNHSGDTRVGNCFKTVQKFKMCFLFVRGLVHGLWDWFDLHFPLLAPSGL